LLGGVGAILAQNLQVHGQQGQTLIEIVVEFPSDAAVFLFLGVDEAAAQVTKRLFRVGQPGALVAEFLVQFGISHGHGDRVGQGLQELRLPGKVTAFSFRGQAQDAENPVSRTQGQGGEGAEPRVLAFLPGAPGVLMDVGREDGSSQFHGQAAKALPDPVFRSGLVA